MWRVWSHDANNDDSPEVKVSASLNIKYAKVYMLDIQHR